MDDLFDFLGNVAEHLGNIFNHQGHALDHPSPGVDFNSLGHVFAHSGIDLSSLSPEQMQELVHHAMRFGRLMYDPTASTHIHGPTSATLAANADGSGYMDAGPRPWCGTWQKPLPGTHS